MNARPADFTVNSFDQVMIEHACLNKAVESVVDIVGCHMIVERRQVGGDGLAIFTGDSP